MDLMRSKLSKKYEPAPFTFTTGRGVDLDFFTNQLVVGLSIAAAGGAALIQTLFGQNELTALYTGVIAAITIFLTWALGREIDPDHHWSAFWGVAFATIGFFAFPSPDLWHLAALLLIVRFINFSATTKPSLIDYLIVLLLVGWRVYAGSWELGLLLFVALFISTILPKGRNISFFAGFISLVGTITIMAWQGFSATFLPITMQVLAALAALFSVYLPAMLAAGDPTSVCDATGEKLNKWRVHTGQLFLLAAVTTSLLARSELTLLTLLPAWSALFGVGLYHWLIPHHKK